MNRQPTPLLVSGETPRQAMRLARSILQKSGTAGYDEAFIQNLVNDCPGVLPVGQIEPAFWPAYSVCTELPLRSGSLDNLLVTPLGDLIAVECKLWRNPQARREVVAQIIDYAKDIQSMSYDDFQDAIRKARKQPDFDLVRHVNLAAGEAEATLDEIGFIDAVARNLRLGRCLLLIAGDGISENVEALTEFLQQHAGMHFTLALVQLQQSRAGLSAVVGKRRAESHGQLRGKCSPAHRLECAPPFHET